MSKWIKIKDRLPEHHATVLVCTPKGQAVSIFVDGKIMADVLIKQGFEPHPDTKKFYFCSQETKQHTLNGVTHWMPLPEAPNE